MKIPGREVIETFKKTPGAVGVVEGLAIYTTILNHLKAGEGSAVELGSHCGKSAIFSALALKDMGRKDHVYLVDLLYDFNNPDWAYTAQGSSEKVPWNHTKVETFIGSVFKLMTAYAPFMFCLSGKSSVEFLKKTKFPLSYVFIDTDDHQEELVREECDLIMNRMLPGGLLLFHDCGCQYQGPTINANRIVGTGKFEKIEIDWPALEALVSLEDERQNDSWHWHHIKDHIEHPRFVGATRRKG